MRIDFIEISARILRGIFGLLAFLILSTVIGGVLLLAVTNFLEG